MTATDERPATRDELAGLQRLVEALVDLAGEQGQRIDLRITLDERDQLLAEVQRLTKERDEYRAEAVRQADRANAAEAGAKQWEAIGDASTSVRNDTAERIAMWLNAYRPSAITLRDFGVQNERVEDVAKMLAADIRAGRWKGAK